MTLTSCIDNNIINNIIFFYMKVIKTTLTSLRTVTAPTWLQPARDLLRSTPFRPILLAKLLASIWSPFSAFFQLLTFNVCPKNFGTPHNHHGIHHCHIHHHHHHHHNRPSSCIRGWSHRQGCCYHSSPHLLLCHLAPGYVLTTRLTDDERERDDGNICFLIITEISNWGNV